MTFLIEFTFIEKELWPERAVKEKVLLLSLKKERNNCITSANLSNLIILELDAIPNSETSKLKL